jgi:hypothetical protein
MIWKEFFHLIGGLVVWALLEALGLEDGEE